jgi:hypothetical protein
MSQKPGVALDDVRFAEGPHIVKRGTDYYLRYRIALGSSGNTPMRLVVDASKGNNRGYYFFIAPATLPERSNVVERSLAADGLSEYARRGAVYWLNPDGSEVLLEIKEEPEQIQK